MLSFLTLILVHFLAKIKQKNGVFGTFSPLNFNFFFVEKCVKIRVRTPREETKKETYLTALPSPYGIIQTVITVLKLKR